MSAPRPLRVLHVLHRMDFGGVESWLLGLLRLADPREVTFDFLVNAAAPGTHEAEIARLGGTIIRGASPHRPLAFRRHLLEVLRERGPYDVVHSHQHFYSGFVLQAASSAKVPVRLAHSHNVTPPERGLLRRLYAWQMRRWIHRHATAGLAASVPAIANLFGEAPDPRWRVLLYGIDLTPFRAPVDRNAVRASLGLPADAFVIGHVGRLVAQKNHAFLLRIAAELPQAHVLLVGDGDLRKNLERESESLGIQHRCVFAGGRHDVPALLRAMDVFLFPSHFEGLGLAVVEAQAAGLPVVTATTTPSEALIVPGACTVLPLSASITTWANAVQQAKVPPGVDPMTVIAASPFDQLQGWRQLLALYRGTL